MRRFGGTELQHPRAVCADGKGRVIVLECKIQRIVLFHGDGRLIKKLPCSACMDFPVGVAANDLVDEIYVADNHMHCVNVRNILLYILQYFALLFVMKITHYVIN